jgi:hypothetical protein
MGQAILVDGNLAGQFGGPVDCSGACGSKFNPELLHYCGCHFDGFTVFAMLVVVTMLVVFIAVAMFMLSMAFGDTVGSMVVAGVVMFGGADYTGGQG